MATVRCEEIANEKFLSFSGNEVPAFHHFHFFYSICFNLNIFIWYLNLEIVELFNTDTGVAGIGRGCSIWSCFWIREQAQFNS